MSELLKINVSEHTEKKNGLTYLSWAWAWSEVLKLDPQATWEAIEFDGFPCAFAPDGSAMVKTVVTIKGHAKSCWLPVMNHRNQAIKNPDAFQINTAMVRCLTKCISMHGLGLYIYAGEDLPQGESEKEEKQSAKITGKAVLKEIYEELTIDRRKAVDKVASAVMDHYASDDIVGAFEEYNGLTDSDERAGAWYLLPSYVRTAITKHGETLKETA